MLNTYKKMGVVLLALTVSGLIFVVVSGDELPPAPPQQSSPNPPQEPHASEQPIPQPHIDPNSTPPAKPPEPSPQASPGTPQPRTDPNSALPSEKKEISQPPASPAPPSEKNITKDEIWHAYNEFQDVEALLSNSQKTEEIKNLENIARQFYTKSEKLYEEGRYKESRVYAHLTVEILHGIRDIMRGR